MAVGGAEVVDVACSSLHAGGVLHQTGLLARRQSGGLEPQQLCNILLCTGSTDGDVSPKIAFVLKFEL